MALEGLAACTPDEFNMALHSCTHNDDVIDPKRGRPPF